ncbi:hemerythrin domain-containing protein [Actinomadura sp. 6K520]|uniref:hemerythrin domain-containing protein n=1 Tax=Actinomadura sp. 6K520 TaxID=2530364 RepID=UPI00104AEE55|nr:hemerythrin domain-containing protein [Actinomadura sp. 6K520]TDE14404.1 hemerythrin domain-containing protein [Actinomadura sp. 6K520]
MGAFAIQPRDVICHTLVHAAHDAFRRDLDRLAAAAAAGKGGRTHVRAGWDNLKDQIRLHHDLEDAVLWPRVERAAGRPGVRAVLAQMHAEHARIGPLAGRVDAAMRDCAGGDRADRAGRDGRDGGDLPAAVRELRETVEAHLRHEEMSAVPLAESVLRPADWRAVAEEAGGRWGAEAWLFVPWVVDGIAPVERSRFLTSLPAPLRERNRVVWEPRYRKRRLWSL